MQDLKYKHPSLLLSSSGYGIADNRSCQDVIESMIQVLLAWLLDLQAVWEVGTLWAWLNEGCLRIYPDNA